MATKRDRNDLPFWKRVLFFIFTLIFSPLFIVAIGWIAGGVFALLKIGFKFFNP
jgi:hypothetical protein